MQVPSDKGGKITAFHMVIVGLSLTLTLGAWQYSVHQMETRNKLRFEAARDSVVGLISDRMTKYEDALWAGVAAIDSHGGSISYQDWKNFSTTLRIEERYPGINGIGVIHFLTENSIDEYLSEQRQTRPGFRVFPQHDNPIFMPITFIEPVEMNAAAVGLDVAHELNRRTAALASRDSGSAQITGPIVLVQDAGKTPGFLFYAPFYRSRAGSEMLSRQEQALGAVYAPFVVHKLMQGLLAKELRGVRFSITDSGETIYDEHIAEDAASDPEPMFEEVVSLDLYGRNWQLDMRTDLTFRADHTYAKPTLILVAGLLIEALIVALLVIMSRANRRAVSYADRVTKELKLEKGKLIEANELMAEKNEELERFAYVASHDLKTPMRGIRGLTEMILEDLEDYLESGTAHPEVRSNLTLIQDRVVRMEQLTDGIMTISRLEAENVEAAPIALEDIVAALRLDFRLDEHQLVLSCPPAAISVDAVHFTSVLENLVGNAIKYHDGEEEIQIKVSARCNGDRWHISVADNGPGIDAKYHEQIFKVFQTLRTEKDIESTGIGLSIVKKAVERHGGTVTLFSTPGKGAVFSFEWPVDANSPRAENGSKAA